MSNNISMPSFGVLSGVKVVHASQSVAGPFAAALMADWGAEVIWVENPTGVDVMRWNKYMMGQDRRNMRSVSLDIPSEQGRKVFFELIKDAHIFLESSKGGQWTKWGLTDEVLWEQNPALVIAHVSGFGQTGDPDYVKRPSFDPIAQAFGGTIQHNGYPDRPPIAIQPLGADAYTALFACCSCLAALNKAKETGKGESIDIAQYECMVRAQFGMLAESIDTGKKIIPYGDHSGLISGWGSYTCKDGKQVYILAASGGVLRNAIKELGLEYGSELFPAGIANVFMGSPAEAVFEAAWKEYLASKTAEEAEKRLSEIGVPCSLIMNYEQMLTNSHYLARETITEWDTQFGEKFKGTTIVPLFKNHPGQVWRGCPPTGYDNELVLRKAGFSDEQIQELYEKKVISKKD